MPRKARSRSLSSTSPATLPNSIPTNRYGTMPKLGWRSGLSRLKRSSKRHCSRSYCLFSVQPDSYSHSSNSQRLSTPQVRSSADTCATVDSVDVLEDVHEAGKKRQSEIRSLTTRELARNVATANHYLNVPDIENSLAAAATGSNAGFTRLIKLPNKTWEGRECHAIKIGQGSVTSRPGIYFLGGIHAREWGSPDILIHFVEQLCDAYRTQSGITLGGMDFTAVQIQKIVNEKDVYVFPQANPDGRHHSMTQAPNWRKNRRHAPAGSSNPDCVGVDLNRNYDFLWNYTVHFDPNAPVANSTDPCDHDVYIGPAPLSEPETKNVVWMFDNFPNIRYFIDIHSYSEDILYNWGDDQGQSQKPGMSFLNPRSEERRVGKECR